mgnify:CR=1 FL=1
MWHISMYTATPASDHSDALAKNTFLRDDLTTLPHTTSNGSAPEREPMLSLAVYNSAIALPVERLCVSAKTTQARASAGPRKRAKAASESRVGAPLQLQAPG